MVNTCGRHREQNVDKDAGHLRDAEAQGKG